METKILLVDDDQDILDLFDHTFAEAGFETTAINNGVEASKLVAKNKFDVIVTDLVMQDIDGIALTSMIRSNMINCSTPIFIISGRLDHENLIKLKKMGVAYIIPKPPKLVELIAQVKQIVSPEGGMVEYEPEVLEAFKKSTTEVLSTYVKGKVFWGESALSRKAESPGPYSATIALFGQAIYGSVSFSADGRFIREVADSLFGDNQINHTNEMLLSFIGELINQIAGAVKLDYGKKKIHVTIGLPEVWEGEHRLPHKVPQPSARIPLRTESGYEAWLDICLGDRSRLIFSPEGAKYQVFRYAGSDQQKKRA